MGTTWIRRMCVAMVVSGLAMAGVYGDGAGAGQHEALAKQFAQVRDSGARALSPGELALKCDELAAGAEALIVAGAGTPSAKSKGQLLLSQVLDFAGRGPESVAAYSAYLDTLEVWQGRDYAVMVVRRAGERSLEGGDPSKAVRFFDLLTEKYPSASVKAQALYESGMACLASKAFSEAARRFDAAAAVDAQGPYAPWALRRKSHALAEQEPDSGDFAKSMQVLDELVQRFPTKEWKAYAHYRKGYLLARQGKKMEALAEYWQGINLHPSSPYSEAGRKHVKQLQEGMERESLDKVAREEGGAAPPAVASLVPPARPRSETPSAHADFDEEAGR